MGLVRSDHTFNPIKMKVHRDPKFCFYFMDIILLSKFLELEVKVLGFNAILIFFVDFKELSIPIGETLNNLEVSKSVAVLRGG